MSLIPRPKHKGLYFGVSRLDNQFIETACDQYLSYIEKYVGFWSPELERLSADRSAVKTAFYPRIFLPQDPPRGYLVNCLGNNGYWGRPDTTIVQRFHDYYGDYGWIRLLFFYCNGKRPSNDTESVNFLRLNKDNGFQLHDAYPAMDEKKREEALRSAWRKHKEISEN